MKYNVHMTPFKYLLFRKFTAAFQLEWKNDNIKKQSDLQYENSQHEIATSEDYLINVEWFCSSSPQPKTLYGIKSSKIAYLSKTETH